MDGSGLQPEKNRSRWIDSPGVRFQRFSTAMVRSVLVMLAQRYATNLFRLDGELGAESLCPSKIPQASPRSCTVSQWPSHSHRSCGPWRSACSLARPAQPRETSRPPTARQCLPRARRPAPPPQPMSPPPMKAPSRRRRQRLLPAPRRLDLQYQRPGSASTTVIRADHHRCSASPHLRPKDLLPHHCPLDALVAAAACRRRAYVVDAVLFS